MSFIARCFRVLVALTFVAVCLAGNVTTNLAGKVTSNGWYIPTPGTTFYWQISDPNLGTSHKEKIFDVDGFGVSVNTITWLKSMGKKVFCYFSFGTAEDYRSDYKDFPRSTLGGLGCMNEDCSETWPGERWLDVKSSAVRQILEKRIQLAKRKGCDGIEPDNVMAYSSNIMVKPISRFTITAKDQFNFNTWIANTVHRYGMSVGLKNPGALAPSYMANLFDWALVESCNYFSDWSSDPWYSGKYQCDYSNEFIIRNKAVFSVEYKELWGTSPGTVNSIQFPQALCADNNARGFMTRLYDADLGVGPSYSFANCMLHKPAGCNVWKECIKLQVYNQYKQQGMARWDAVGQCVRARRAACRYA
ncbi:hypothetical protein CLOM_g6526 [Closterium sp. NIES-68]|nr:hypothetical protein CLOM_g6526 [Closterium sp. NIES-68]GJP75660.1 hypothetical protein CLOP_g6084 [Closterium sp. NIES-67]